MKKLILLALVLCSAATMLAQTNRMSYQAVVRNAANELVAEENLTVAISISDANGTSAYSETHSVTSNRNGVISLMIGEGSSQSGNMTSVDWRTAQIHTVITLPGGATLSNTTPVNAVPYAFYADSVDVQWVSDVIDDYLEHHNISSIVETDPTVPDWAKEANKPAYDYSEIANTPDLSGYLTAETDPTVPDWAKEATKPAYDYSEIANTPDLSGYLTAETDPTVPDWAKESTKPAYDYSEIVNTPDLSGYLTVETDPTVPDWAKETTKPAYDYSEIVNTPDLSGYLTAETDPTVPDWAKEATKPAYDYSEIVNTPDLSGYLTAETDPTVPDWAKEATKPAYDYSEIANTPDLSGYLTAENDPTVPDWAKEANKPTYDYSEIENTPTIPTVPTEVSAFTNDANYITNSNTSCANSVDLCELLEKLELLENQLEPIMILTQGVTAVTQNSFTVNGKVQTDGSSTVTQRGFVYSSSNPTPSISDYRVNCGSGTGTYSYTVTGLTPGITYYVRAFATNENGTFYGSVVAVTTTATSPSTLPSVTTIAVTNVTTTEATVTGTVTSDGGEPVTQRGFVYGTEPNPTLSSTVANHGTGTGNFSNLLTNLLSGETYYVRAFATNSLGTAYGNQITFVTSVPTTVEGDAIPCPGTPTVTDHEGNVYNTVQIGTQCWTKENMRATTSPSTGTYLIPPAGTSPTYTGKQAWWYDNDSATYAPRNYGLLYNWNAAVDTFNTAYGEISVNTGGNNVVSVRFTGNRRGICPAGWHLPSNAEWTQLENYVGSQSEYTCGGNSNYIAKALASETDWNTNTGNCAVGYNQSSNNVTDFSAVPTGGYGGSSFGGTGNDANFWSSTQYSGNITYSRYLHYNNAEVGMAGSHEKYFGYSVRCLRD